MSKTALQREEKHTHAPGCGCGHDATYVRPEPKIGRNDPCPCGSGKKWKKCCGAKTS